MLKTNSHLSPKAADVVSGEGTSVANRYLPSVRGYLLSEKSTKQVGREKCWSVFGTLNKLLHVFFIKKNYFRFCDFFFLVRLNNQTAWLQQIHFSPMK